MDVHKSFHLTGFIQLTKVEILPERMKQSNTWSDLAFRIALGE